MTFTASYTVPATARLMVEVEHSHPREATADDLKKFGLVPASDANMAVNDALVAAMNSREDTALERNKDLVKCHLNSLRYLAECAIHYGDRGKKETGVDTETLEDVAVIERTLALAFEGRGIEASDLYRAHLAKRAAELEGGTES